MPLPNSLEAGSAFSKFFKRQGNTTISDAVQYPKQGVQHYDMHACGQVEETHIVIWVNSHRQCFHLCGAESVCSKTQP